MPTRRPHARTKGVAALVAAASLAAPSAASAAIDRDRLWATVNVCDTERRENVVGIRVSMPGSGRRAERMHVRIVLQYRDAEGDWRRIARGGDSGWIALGHARVKARETGRDFEVAPPREGSSRLRGLVLYEWRRSGEVVRRTRRRTTGGHGDTTGADPPGASAATCVVR